MSLSVGVLLGATLGMAAAPADLPADPPARGATVAVLPASITDARSAVVREALAEAGYPDAVFVPRADFIAAAQLVRVDGLPDADECAERVSLEEWRGRFEAARARFQLLAFADALAELVSLDVELVCLSSPPATSDLFRLELGLAEAHTFLAQAAGADEGGRSFHDDEAGRALARAASFGASLSAPADLPPEVLAAYDARRRQRAEADAPRVLVTGPGARVGARFNGRPLPDTAFDAVPGANLVQAADGATVTVAARLRLTGGRTLVWLAPDGTGAPTVDDALVALAEGDLADDGKTLLGAAGRLVGDGATVLYVVDRPAGPTFWEAVPGGLAPVAPASRAPGPTETWRVVLGVGPSVGWSTIAGGVLDGLGGPNAGVSLHARVAVARWVAVAATVDPWAVGAPIPVEQGGGTMMRATIPARLGVRFGQRTSRLAVEGGVDAGLHWFGRFPEEGGEVVPRASFLAGGAVGLSGAVGPHMGMRLQGWFGAGIGYVAGGATLGLEGRL